MAYMPGGGIARLGESLSSLPESEGKIAKFILEHPTKFVKMTVHELAKESGGSPAAVVRLWKSLEFDGYGDFKLRVATDLHSTAQSKYTELSDDNSFGDILRTVEESNVRSIQNTLHLLRESDVKAVADALLRAKRILCMGVGASAVVADDFAQKLVRIGIPVNCTADFHQAAVLASQLKSTDVFVAISYSGKTSDVCEVAEIAAGNGAAVIAITRFGDSQLSTLADVNLYISAIEPQVRAAATVSRISALVTIDTLFIYLANQDKERVYKSLETTRDVVQSHKLT